MGPNSSCRLRRRRASEYHFLPVVVIASDDVRATKGHNGRSSDRVLSGRTLGAGIALCVALLGLPGPVVSYFSTRIERDAVVKKAASDERIAHMQLEAARIKLNTARLTTRPARAPQSRGSPPRPPP